MESLENVAIREAAIQICKNLYEKEKSWPEVEKQADANIKKLTLPEIDKLKLAKAVEQIYNELKLPGLLYKAAEETGNAEGEFYYRKILVELWPYFSTKERKDNLSNLVYGAAKEIKNGGETHDKKLLLDLWPHVPIEDREGIINDFFDGKKLVSELLGIDDKESLIYILHNVTEAVKEKFIFTGSGQDVAVQLVYKDKLELLEFLIRQCLSSEEKIDGFKRDFLCKWPGIGIYIKLIRQGKFDAVEKLIGWCFFSKEEIKNFKKELAYKSGGRICHDLIICKQGDVKYCEEEEKWELVETFLAWCFSSEEEIEKFKREVILSQGVIENICLTLILREKCEKKWELAEAFLKWCSFPKEEEINTFKEQLMYSVGVKLYLYDLLYEDDMEREESWKEIELLTRWCLRSKEAAIRLKERFEIEPSLEDIEDCRLWPSLESEDRNTFSKLLNELIKPIPSEKKTQKRKIEESNSGPAKKLRITETYNVTSSQVKVI